MTENIAEVKEIEENVIYYNSREEVLPILEREVEGRFQRYMPLKLMAEYPELLDRESIILEDQYIAAIDFPGFSSVMNKYPELGTNFFCDVRLEIGRLVDGDHSGIFPLKNAGDELLSTASSEEVALDEIITFGLESQLAFMNVLERDEYSELKAFIEDVKQLDPPYIHVGISYGDLCLRVNDLGPDPKNGDINRIDLMVSGGSSLIVKDMAKGKFTAVTAEAIDTSEFPILSELPTHESELSPDEIPEITVESGAKIGTGILTALGNAGTQVEKPSGYSPHYDIDVPGDGIQEAREGIENAIAALKEAKNGNDRRGPDRRERSIDISKLRFTAKYMTHPSNRTIDLVRPPHSAVEGENTGSGEACFYGISGLSQMRKEISRMELQNIDPQDLASLAVSESSAYIIGEMAKVITAQGWDVEHSEFDANDVIKLITENNIFQLNQVNNNSNGLMSENPNVLYAIAEAIDLVNKPEFGEAIKNRLHEKFGEYLNYATISEIVDRIPMRINAGLASCEPEDEGLSWVMVENSKSRVGERDSKINCYGSPPAGSATSSAARYWSSIDHKRALQRKTFLDEESKKRNLSEEEFLELQSLSDSERQLADLALGNYLVMQHSMAKKIRISDQASATFIFTPKGSNQSKLSAFRI